MLITRHGILVTVLATLYSVSASAAIMGFADPAPQLALEAQFRESLSSEDQAEWARALSARPHHPGSEHGAANAAYIAERFSSWGFEVEVEEFDILLPVPLQRSLELLAPSRYVAGLSEDIVGGDASSAQRDDVLPSYNAFSVDGDVTGQLVFVNYGIPEDYELLERYGIDVEGKIVIAKYGKSWRGIKPKLAAEKGAIGTLIYSDPADDGYVVGDVYPEGPWKNASGVQRGSVMDMPLYPGDVLTPGKPAIKGTRRLKPEDAPTLTTIPVLPISYRDARPLLAALGGETVPAEWRGGLPITYHLGPGPAEVRLQLKFDWQRIPIRNVIARWPGERYPDQWVLRGNHHDGWNHGAADPVSGMVALMSEAKALATLARAGHPPQRTVIYAAWDAEEPGLIGSTEWVEKHIAELDENAVVYINTDGNSRGFLGIGGSHTLEPFFNQVAETVMDPQTGVSVAERLRAAIMVGDDAEQRQDLEARKDIRIAPLGSGSDYTPFLQHAGIASANLGFGGEGVGGSYHTLYDTFEHFTRFRDPGFRYGVTLADLAGTATLRMANAGLLPFRFSGLADNLQRYLEEVETLADEQREKAERINGLIIDGSFELAADPQKTLQPPAALPPVPFFNFAPLQNVLADLDAVAEQLDAALAAGQVNGNLVEINERLYRSERMLTSADGLPGREWYTHQVYAPGFYTGYGVKTLPRVRESIEAELYADVNDEIAATAAVLEAFVSYLRELAAELER